MKGQCFCGEVKYELTSDLLSCFYCHCTDCQKFSGSAFHVLGHIEEKNFTLFSGNLSNHKHPTADGNEMTREFCSNCGTPLFLKITLFKGFRGIIISSLDEPESVKPKVEIWTKSKLSWAHIPPEIESFHEVETLDYLSF